ncbi:MAG: adenosylhomocysteinase, partial [Nitrososphaerota archaeon]|nr:adenosylhomocysteinase [Nitrososphaerota archaeon]
LTERVSHVYAWRGETPKEYDDNHRLILNDRPNIIIDDGADLSIMAIEAKRTKGIIGAAEETTTGVKRFKALEREHLLKFPVIAVNDAKGKYLYDSRFGTGQSSVDGILRSTNMMIGGKRAVVAGYGWVGRGVASRLRGMGANVTVVEVDPYRALEAYFDGYTVNGMNEASQYGDLFITCTGNVRVITLKHFEKMKDGAILLNVGHFDVEVDARALRQNASSIKDVRPNVREFTMKGGKKLYLLAEGRLANLAAADGHPIEVMDLTFGLQLQSAIYLAKNHQKMKDIVYKVPDDIDELTVRRFLELNGIRVDRLTDEQKKYQKSWQEIS